MEPSYISEDKLRIRKINFNDIKIIRKIRLAASNTSKTHYNAKDIKIMNKAGEHFLLDFFNPRRKSFVAIYQKKIVWYITINTSKSRLWHIFVDPQYSHKGIGKYLTKQTMIIFKKHKGKCIKLYARLNAVDFYKKLGFEDIKSRTWCNIFTGFKPIQMRYMIKKINNIHP